MPSTVHAVVRVL